MFNQSEMSPRQRVVAALNHQQPDRAPLDMGGSVASLVEGAYWPLKARLGIQGDGGETVSPIFVMLDLDERVLQALGIDFRRVRLRSPANFVSPIFEDGSWADEWGLRQKKAGHYAIMVGHPLAEADANDLDTFAWPDPFDPARGQGLAEQTQQLYAQTNYALVAHLPGGVFETALYLRGFATFLIDLKRNRRFAEKLLNKVFEVICGYYEVMLNAVGPYVQMVETADDLGIQTGPMLAPRLYRETVKPLHRQLFAEIKRRTTGKIFMHSCGGVRPFIEDLIEVGLDVLNPIQPQAAGMELAALKRDYGERLAFHGGIDAQTVLPLGTPEDVTANVRHVLEVMSPGGGYILAPAHNFQPDTPPENIVAMYRAGQMHT
jgi:uroporphyrinogen decarboxylase